MDIVDDLIISYNEQIVWFLGKRVYTYDYMDLQT